MVIVMRPGATEDQLQTVIQRVEEYGLTPHVSRGETQTIVG